MKNEHQGGMGPAGNCVCPACGYSARHRRGVPCLQERCAKCGKALVREGSYHDQLIKEKKGSA